MPLPLPEYDRLDATGMAALVADGELSPRDLLEAALAKLRQFLRRGAAVSDAWRCRGRPAERVRGEEEHGGRRTPRARRSDGLCSLVTLWTAHSCNLPVSEAEIAPIACAPRVTDNALWPVVLLGAPHAVRLSNESVV